MLSAPVKWWYGSLKVTCECCGKPVPYNDAFPYKSGDITVWLCWSCASQE